MGGMETGGLTRMDSTPASGPLTRFVCDGGQTPGGGLNCGHAAHAGRVEAENDDVVRDDAATKSTTDLRRARQRARSVIRDILADILAWMGANDVQSMVKTDAGARRANRAITEIASQRLREDLLGWLDERHRIVAGRGVRDAQTKMSQAFDGVDDERLVGPGEFDRQLDRETLRQVRQVDAGLLFDTELAEQLGLNEPLAEELGDDITRQLRQGVANGESISGGLSDRVEYVITDGDSPERREKGVTGQTKRSKAELIAHDSVQDAYNQAARGRYLRNGFRYGAFDATVDTKTTDICLRMNEHVIDLRDTPFFVPPLHPYCRSGIRPILDIGNRTVLRRDDVADGFLQTIMQTKSYRPPANAAGDFRPTPLTRDQGQV